MATTKKRWSMQGFQGANGDWYIRTITPNKKKGATNFSVTEGYAGKKSGVKRAAQSFVTGFQIPIVRLDIMSLKEDRKIEASFVLRAGKPAQTIAITDQTPTE